MLLQGPRPGGAEGGAATATAARFLSRHALLLVVGIGALVRFATLASQDYWFDEYLSVGIIQLGPGEIIDRTIGNDTSPPLYFLIAAGWERVFGTGEVALRSLSALFGTATIPIAYAAGVALGSRRAGLFAAALTASSPLMIWYSQEARPYALFALLSTISFLCFVHALNGRGRGWLGGWVAASVLALGTHYFAIFLIVAEAAWLLWRSVGARRSAAIAIAIVSAAGLALLAIAAERAELAGWIAGIDFSDRVLQVPQHFVVGLNTPWEALAPVATVATLLVAFRALLRAEAETRRIVAVAGSVTLIGTGMPLAAPLLNADYLLSRNLIGLWAPAAIALAALLAAPQVDRLRRPAPNRLGAATAAALCVGGLAIAVWTAATPAAGRPDWGELARGLGPAQVKRVIASEHYQTRPFGPHLDASQDLVFRVQTPASELDVIDFRKTTDYGVGPCWWGAGCGGSPATAPVRAPRGFALVDEGATPLFEYRRYRAREPRLLPPPDAGCAHPRNCRILEAWVQWP